MRFKSDIYDEQIKELAQEHDEMAPNNKSNSP